MKSETVMDVVVRTVWCMVVATAMLGASGCSGKPSARDCRSVVENVAAQDGNFSIKNFKKVNATTSSLLGQEMYTVHCTWDQVYVKDSSGGLFEQARKKGEVVHTPDGNLIFQKTEKGWQGMDGKVY